MDITILMLFHKLKEKYPEIDFNIPEHFRKITLKGIRLYSHEFHPEPDHYLYICDPHVPEVEEELAKNDPVLLISPERPSDLNPNIIYCNHHAGTAPIFNSLQEIWTFFLDWDREIHEMLLKDASFQDLLEASAPFIQNTVLIYDRALRLISYNRPNETDDEIFQNAVSEGFLPPEITREFSEDRVLDPDTLTEPIFFHAKKYNTLPVLYQPFSYSGKITGFLVMLCHNVSDVDYSRHLFSNFYSSVAICMERYMNNRLTTGRMEEYMLINILENVEMDEEKIQRHTENLGIPFFSTFYLLGISFPDKNNSVRHYLLSLFQMVLPFVFAIEYKEQILFLVYGDHKIDPLMYKEQLPKQFSSVLSEIQQYDLPFAASFPFYRLSEIRSAYKQIQLILSAPEFINDIDHGKIVFLDNYLITYVRSDLEKEYGIDPATPYIDAIKKGEGEKYPLIHDIVYSYLINNCNITKTAASLHMHRNNVIYHIKRLESRYNLNLQDMDTLVRLYISLSK